MSDTQIASNTCWMMNEHLPLLSTQINSPLFISKLFHINCYLSILFGLIILKTFSLEKTIISFKHIMQNFKEQTQCPKMLKTFRFKNKCVSHTAGTRFRAPSAHTPPLHTHGDPGSDSETCEKPEPPSRAEGTLSWQTAKPCFESSNLIDCNMCYLQHTAPS